MINKKKCLFALLTLLLLIIDIAKAQTFTIKSLDDASVKIKVYNLLSGRKLVVSCAKDTLFLDEFIGIRNIHILKKQFLKIVYDGRGGTGLDIKNTLILSVMNNKIIVSMLVTSYANWISPNPDNPSVIDKNNTYKINFNMAGNEKNDYKLIVNVHDQQKSKLHPESNCYKNRLVTLKFDTLQNIFCSAHKSISQLFTINDPKMLQSVKQQVNGTLPIIALGRNNYYYIKGSWYGSGYGDNLFKNYYK